MLPHLPNSLQHERNLAVRRGIRRTRSIVDGQVVQRCLEDVVVSHFRPDCVGGTTGGEKGGLETRTTASMAPKNRYRTEGKQIRSQERKEKTLYYVVVYPGTVTELSLIHI